MNFIIRTISNTDYIIETKEEKIIDLNTKIMNIMDSKIFNFIDSKGNEYYINTQYIEGIRIVK